MHDARKPLTLQPKLAAMNTAWAAVYGALGRPGCSPSDWIEIQRSRSVKTGIGKSGGYGHGPR